MTLIIGMDCMDCLLFCADREEGTESGGKRSVSKIHHATGNNWGMMIATSGCSSVSDVAAQRIIASAKATPSFNVNPQQVIEDIMFAVYEKYVFPRDRQRQRERDINLVLGIVDEENRQRFLFKTFEEIVKPESHYACAGAGMDIAYYFLDRLRDDSGFGGDEAMKLLAFILREAKSSVGMVGRESEFVSVVHRRDCSRFSTRTLIGEAVDWKQIPMLSHCLVPFWRSEQK